MIKLDKEYCREVGVLLFLKENLDHTPSTPLNMEKYMGLMTLGLK